MCIKGVVMNAAESTFVTGLEIQIIHVRFITLGSKVRKSIAIKFVAKGSTALYSN